MILDLSNTMNCILLLVLLALWVWVLYDIIFVSTVSASEKLFWVIIVLIFNLIGIIFYLLLGRKESDYKIVKRK